MTVKNFQKLKRQIVDRIFKLPIESVDKLRLIGKILK